MVSKDNIKGNFSLTRHQRRVTQTYYFLRMMLPATLGLFMYSFLPEHNPSVQ